MTSTNNKGYKGTVEIRLDPDLLLSAKKYLFSKGLSVTSLFRYVLEKLAVQDVRICELIDEAKEHEITQAINKNDFKSLDAEALYALIEKDGEGDE